MPATIRSTESDLSYVDPIPADRSERCARSVRDLRSRGLVVFGRWREGQAGLLLSKTINKLRLILDPRRANTRYHAPPRVEMVTAEGLSPIHLDMFGGAGSVPVVGPKTCKTLFAAWVSQFGSLRVLDLFQYARSTWILNICVDGDLIDGDC